HKSRKSYLRYNPLAVPAVYDRPQLRNSYRRASTMRAIRVSEFGGPEVLKIQDVPDPKPDSGQVLVRVKAAGINPVDAYIRSGTYARKPNLPYTPGTDAGGVVEAVGANVKRFKAGDRVYTNGSSTGVCAELALCDESRVHPLPPKISFAQGAALGVP